LGVLEFTWKVEILDLIVVKVSRKIASLSLWLGFGSL
jgi:hypothetical protein